MKNKYYILTLGCQMNISDSQRIAQKLEDLGYKSAPEKEADLVIVNACSVRQSAVDRIWGKAKIWQSDGKKVFITGCILKDDHSKFVKKNIHVFNIQELPKLGKILEEHSNILLNNRILSKNIKSYLNYFDIKPKVNSRIAYIPIMTGCDNFCSYCAVPYTRGREVSRPIKDILTDVKDALNSGFKEILLLGQNVNSYNPIHTVIARSEATKQSIERSPCFARDDKINNTDFIELLKTIDDLSYDFTFNFMSSNPHDMSDDLIQCFANLKKWPRELHLAMQSGDDEILKKMNRKYNSKQYFNLVNNLKLKIPTSPAGGENLKLSTDIIVGFPGETKKQFNNTVKVCKKIGFQKAYVAQYSPRPGTAAAKLKDDVLKLEKKRRWLILDQLINK